MRCDLFHIFSCLMTLWMLLEGVLGRPRPWRRSGRDEGRRLPRPSRYRSRRFLQGSDPWERAWNAVYLTSQTGFNLAVDGEGNLVGSSSDGAHAKIQRCSLDAGLVLLKSVQSGKYIGMDEHGRLITTTAIGEENHFIESVTSNFYTTFLSSKYARNRWYIGIRRNGQLFHNRRKRRNQGVQRQAVLFMVRPIQS